MDSRIKLYDLVSEKCRFFQSRSTIYGIQHCLSPSVFYLIVSTKLASDGVLRVLLAYLLSQKLVNEKHPKRKKDSANPYTLSIENCIKYGSFEESEGYIQKIEINCALFSLFDEFELEDIFYRNVVSRHHEHSELTEQALNDYAFHLPEQKENAFLFFPLFICPF